MSSAVTLAASHDAAGNHEDAVNELANASREGDVAAMTVLGKRLVAGDRAPLLPAEGQRLLVEAMQAGSAEAAERLAVLAALGAHMDQSWAGAFALLVSAAERGSESARGQLRVLAGDTAGDAIEGEDCRTLASRIDLRAWISAPSGVALHERPAVRVYAGFLGDQACAWLIERARGRLRRALIYDSAHGGDVADEMRTNSAAGFDLMDVDLVQVMLQHRMAAAVGLPVANMEGPTVLHYDVGEQITDHTDFLNTRMPNYEAEIRRRGERIITFLVYLNDDYGGGETDFPLLGARHRGRRGDGLFFVNALPNGKPDTRMVHAGRPPTHGQKWIVSQFIRNRPALNARAEHVG